MLPGDNVQLNGSKAGGRDRCPKGLTEYVILEKHTSDSWTAPKQSKLDSGYSFILTLKEVISFFLLQMQTLL